MRRGKAPILVLGVGNALLRDDGVGLRLLSDLSREGLAWDGEVEFLDGGTQGLALLDRIAGRHALLILDAVKLGAARGRGPRAARVAGVAGRDLPPRMKATCRNCSRSPASSASAPNRWPLSESNRTGSRREWSCRKSWCRPCLRRWRQPGDCWWSSQRRRLRRSKGARKLVDSFGPMVIPSGQR